MYYGLKQGRANAVGWIYKTLSRFYELKYNSAYHVLYILLNRLIESNLTQLNLYLFELFVWDMEL